MTCGAHTLLGTVIRLFIPASVHLYTDKLAGDLLWTNWWVVWEFTYSDQWEPEQDNQTDPRWPITGFKIGYGGQTGTDRDGEVTYRALGWAGAKNRENVMRSPSSTSDFYLISRWEVKSHIEPRKVPSQEEIQKNYLPDSAITIRTKSYIVVLFFIMFKMD